MESFSVGKSVIVDGKGEKVSRKLNKEILVKKTRLLAF